MIRQVTFAAGLLLALWMVSLGIIWNAYDVRAFINGGAYSYGDAWSAVLHLALLTTVITTAVWISLRRLPSELAAKLFVKTSLLTLIALLVYMWIVLIWRQLWSPLRGTNESAMFMPILGHMNSFFFAESRWISFAIEVAPAISLLSGGLLSLNRLLTRRYPASQTF